MSRRIYRHDEELGMRMVPGVAARPRHEGTSYLVEANADGFRCRHEFTGARRPGTARILLYGDSFVVGPGVAAERRFGDRLERSLEGVEVYNLGLTGSGTDQQYLAHRHVGRSLAHDLVVLTPWVENIRRNPAHSRVWNDRWSDSSLEDRVVLQPKPYFELGPDGELALRNVPVPRAVTYDELGDDAPSTGSAPRLAGLRQLVRRRAPWAKDALQRVSRLQPVPEYDDPEHPSWRLMRAIIERWHGELDRPMLVCPIPMYQHIEGHASADGYLARFRELHRPSDGLVVHDVLPALQQGSSRQRRALRFERDVHLSESGHAAFATALEPAVRNVLSTSPRVG